MIVRIGNVKPISKRHSKNYSKVIEVNMPVSFYWDENEYDGFEFMVANCSKYQLNLVHELGNFLNYQMYCSKLFEYMKINHLTELTKIIEDMDSERLGIPKSFIDAFKNDNEQNQ